VNRAGAIVVGLALVVHASSVRAGTLAIDSRCAAPVEGDALIAQLTLELGGTGWTVAQGATDATLTIETAACAEAAPFDLAFRGAESWSVTIDLTGFPRARRARLLAIAIAELLQPDHAPRAPSIPAAAPLAAADPLAPTDPLAATSSRARARVTRARPAPSATAVAASPPRTWILRAAFLGSDRRMPQRDAPGAALAIAARTRFVPHLVVELAAGLERVARFTAPADFSDFHLDLSVGLHMPIGQRVTAELGARGSATRLSMVARSNGTAPEIDVVGPIAQPWSGAVGIYLRGAVHIAPHTDAILDLGVCDSVTSTEVPVSWTNASAYGVYSLAPLTGQALTISAGLAFE